MVLYIVNEFKKFALRGNILDLAIGVIIGASFNKLVSSLVEDVLMPIVGLFLGKIDFSSLAFSIGGTTLRYGRFIQSSVDFLLVAWTVFIVIKAMNLLHEDTVSVEYVPVDKQQLEILTQIRDAIIKEDKKK